MPSVDLTTLPGWSSLSTGSHNITIVAKADGYRDSEPSAAVSVEKDATYTITPTLTNVIGDSSNPTTIQGGSTATLHFTANSGYQLPDSVTVTGATSSWDKTAGILTLSNPIGNVTVTIIGESTWENPTQDGDILTITQVYTSIQSGSDLSIE